MIEYTDQRRRAPKSGSWLTWSETRQLEHFEKVRARTGRTVRQQVAAWHRTWFVTGGTVRCDCGWNQPAGAAPKIVHHAHLISERARIQQLYDKARLSGTTGNGRTRQRRPSHHDSSVTSAAPSAT